MKNGKVERSVNRPVLPHIWGKKEGTNKAKWGSSSLTKGTFGLWFGLFLSHLTFISRAV
jgi:hypothetical protein